MIRRTHQILTSLKLNQISLYQFGAPHGELNRDKIILRNEKSGTFSLIQATTSTPTKSPEESCA